MDLTRLKNIGRVTADRMKEVGIGTAEELEAAGAVEAYRRLKARFPRETTLNCLYAFHGALLDVRWDHLPRETLQDLKAQVTGEG